MLRRKCHLGWSFRRHQDAYAVSNRRLQRLFVCLWLDRLWQNVHDLRDKWTARDSAKCSARTIWLEEENAEPLSNKLWVLHGRAVFGLVARPVAASELSGQGSQTRDARRSNHRHDQHPKRYNKQGRIYPRCLPNLQAGSNVKKNRQHWNERFVVKVPLHFLADRAHHKHRHPAKVNQQNLIRWPCWIRKSK